MFNHYHDLGGAGGGALWKKARLSLESGASVTRTQSGSRKTRTPGTSFAPTSKTNQDWPDKLGCGQIWSSHSEQRSSEVWQERKQEVAVQTKWCH